MKLPLLDKLINNYYHYAFRNLLYTRYNDEQKTNGAIRVQDLTRNTSTSTSIFRFVNSFGSPQQSAYLLLPSGSFPLKDALLVVLWLDAPL